MCPIISGRFSESWVRITNGTRLPYIGYGSPKGPSRKYVTGMLEGAKQIKLSSDYIKKIEGFSALVSWPRIDAYK